jgi:hypothetical protein
MIEPSLGRRLRTEETELISGYSDLGAIEYWNATFQYLLGGMTLDRLAIN